MIIHNLKVELIDNDKAVKLTKILNDLNVKFTVDNLSKVLEIMLTLYIEQMDINKTIKLIEKLGYTDIFDSQDLITTVKTMEKLMFNIIHEHEFDSGLSLVDKLKYEDVLNMIYQTSIKLYEKIKVELIQEDFQISIQGGLIVNAMRPVLDLQSLTMGSLKTMTLFNLYFKDN